ncbi:redoxin domain-containing protein [Bacteroides sp. 519]|uniref:TlpA family protein disulfide reductase n=1 Tax=Bacteroides sp. 519 TaxID=2302937 RepID=UPI0013CF52BD|nr:redoxin domain-containing protein [Bacteroides sp. 519]NDV57514.1 hypothetical protein [Bacteroides sp. 519]
MKVFRFFWVMLAIVGLTGCVGEDNDSDGEGADIKVGDYLPEFVIDMNNGSKLNSSDLRGKVSVIILFSVDCQHCQEQFKVTEQIYEKYKNNKNFVMFGISREQGAAQVSKYWHDNKMKMPYSAQNDRYIYSLFAKSVIPRIYISNGERIVQAVTTDNPLATFDELVSLIDPLMGIQGNVKVGDKLPNFSITMNDGSEISTDDLKGKISVIIFFATGCEQCRTQLSVAEEVYKRFKDNEKFKVICISRAEGENIVAAYWRKGNYTMPYSAQPTRDVYDLFAQITVPRIYISDTDGVVQEMYTDTPLASYATLFSVVNNMLR